MGCGGSIEKSENYPYPRQLQSISSKSTPEQVKAAEYLSATMSPKSLQLLQLVPPVEEPLEKAEPEFRDQIVISEEHLEEYVRLEHNIHELERQRVLQRLHLAVDRLQCTVTEISALEEKKMKMDTQIKSKELGKGPTNPMVTGRQIIEEIDSIDLKSKRVKDGEFKMKMKFDDVIADDLGTLKSEREAVVQKLADARKVYDGLETEVSKLNGQAAELLDMYLVQDELIVNIFGHGHSTDREAELESKRQTVEEKKNRIARAQRNWKEAQILLEYACKQLAIAVQQWQDLPQVPSINLEVRYLLSPEATQRLRDANKDPIGDGKSEWHQDLPGCTIEELATLESMSVNSRPEVTTSPRNQIAFEDNSDTHKRAVAMLKWFNRVLNTAINRDLVDVSDEVRIASQAVRRERIGILRDRIKTKYGRSIDYGDVYSDESEEALVKKMLSSCKDGKDCEVIHEVTRKTLIEIEKGRMLKATVDNAKITAKIGGMNQVMIL